MTRSITADIATFAINASAPPASAKRIASLSLADWAAVSLAGIDEPVARITRDLVAYEGGHSVATVIGLGTKVPTRAAALANGALSHALDYDDTHFAYVGHPSVAVFPAALAAAESTDASGTAFLEAALIGMEAACRIGHWLGTAHYNHGFHQTATSGAFGATLAAGRLLGLSHEQLTHALGVAATRASGLKSQFGTMGKPFNAGIAASNGVEAALLAKRGFVSRPDGIECAQGFAATHAGECQNLDISLAGLGDTYWFEDVQHKFHACCHGLHAALEALQEIREEGQIAASAVERLTLRVSPRWLRVCDIKSPTTGLEAKFSYRLTTAMALMGVPTGALDSFSDAACADPRLCRIRDCVEVVGDAAISDTAAQVSVTAAGKTVARAHDLDTPLPYAERARKIAAKVRALLPTGAADAILSLETHIDKASARDVAQHIARLASR